MIQLVSDASWPPLSFGHFPRERGKPYCTSEICPVNGGNPAVLRTFAP